MKEFNYEFSKDLYHCTASVLVCIDSSSKDYWRHALLHCYRARHLYGGSIVVCTRNQKSAEDA